MPSFSDFSATSYLTRVCYTPIIFIWMVFQTRKTNRLEPFSLLRLELRPLFILAFSFALLVSLAHDIILYMIKVNEGFDQVEPGKFIEKPESEWNAKDLRLNHISHYLDSASISFITTSLFILQLFWNYVMEQTSRRTYINIFEYWIYLVFSILLLPIFPVLTYLLDASVKDPKYVEFVPRLVVSGIALLLSIAGGLRVHIRLGQLLNSGSRPTLQNEGKLKYFLDLNIWFNVALFIWSASYLVISVNGILNLFNMNRFTRDFLIANANFGRLILYICIISIFNPNFSIKRKPRTISEPFDSVRVSHILIGPDRQIMVETNQDVKIEQAFINPYYRPFTTTPPLTPNSMNIIAPLPSPTSVYAENNRNMQSSPLQQSWKQVQSMNDGSIHQTLDNDCAVLTEHGGVFGTTSDDGSSWQRDETLNESPMYNNNNNNNNNNDNFLNNPPLKRTPSQKNTSYKDMSLEDSMYPRNNSV